MTHEVKPPKDWAAIKRRQRLKQSDLLKTLVEDWLDSQEQAPTIASILPVLYKHPTVLGEVVQHLKLTDDRPELDNFQRSTLGVINYGKSAYSSRSRRGRQHG